MLKLSQDEICFPSHCSEFPCDLPCCWCCSICFLFPRSWFWGWIIRCDPSRRRNLFIHLESFTGIAIAKQVTIQPVNTPAMNHQALFIYLPPFCSQPQWKRSTCLVAILITQCSINISIFQVTFLYFCPKPITDFIKSFIIATMLINRL